MACDNNAIAKYFTEAHNVGADIQHIPISVPEAHIKDHLQFPNDRLTGSILFNPSFSGNPVALCALHISRHFKRLGKE